MRSLARSGMVAALLLVAGCGGDGDAVVTTVETNTASVPEAALDPGNASDGNVAAAAAPAAQEAQEAPLLNVAPDGLTLVDPQSGAARHLAFGTPADAALRAATAALGPKLRERDMAECGAGAMTLVQFPKDLTLNLMDGRFVGWSLAGDAPGAVATASGITLGSTRAELERAYALEMLQETSLGNEFHTGALSGILSTMAPGGTIENLWAGTDCVFR